MSVYAFSDIHGNYNLFKQIQNYINKDDIVYCLGDNCDRGVDGIKIMQEVLADKRFIYILGNHEAMFIDAVKMATRNGRFSFRYYDKQDLELLYYNGTEKTLNEFKFLSDQEQLELIQQLEQLPVYKEYINKDNKRIFLCHAGGDALYLTNPKKETDYYWDRKHIATRKWDNRFFNNLYVVHGHTSAQCLPLYNHSIKISANNKIRKYCEGHKIDIDIATPTTYMIALFNLDNFETIYFKQDKNTSLEKL